jgi:hypothetical protein
MISLNRVVFARPVFAQQAHALALVYVAKVSPLSISLSASKDFFYIF